MPLSTLSNFLVTGQLSELLKGPLLVSKVLILCHNEKVTGSFNTMELNNHWWGSPLLENNPKTFFGHIFQNYNVKDKKGAPIFKTVDNSKYTQNDADYKEDVFDDKFINAHLNEYEVIMVPDCGGNWFEYDQQKKYEDLLDLCLNLTKMLTPGGIITFSKIHDEFPLMLENKLKSSNFTVKYLPQGNIFTKTVVAQKMYSVAETPKM